MTELKGIDYLSVLRASQTRFRFGMPKFASQRTDKWLQCIHVFNTGLYIFRSVPSLALGQSFSYSSAYSATLKMWVNVSILKELRYTLQWSHSEHDGLSNHRPRDCWLKHLFRHRSQKASKLRVTGLREGNSMVTGEFPPKRTSNTENVSIWWRHNDRRKKANKHNKSGGYFTGYTVNTSHHLKTCV